MKIPVSPLAQYANRTTSIDWDPDRRIFVIESTCPRPHYLVRLSGPSLVVPWQTHYYRGDHSRIDGVVYRPDRQRQFPYYRPDDDDGTLAEITMADIVLTGRYHVEILQFTCDSVQDRMRYHCIPNTSELLSLVTDHYLNMTTTTTPSSVGHWKHKQYQDDNPMAPLPPVLTRYQNTDCNVSRSRCDRAWFQNYEYIEPHPDDWEAKITNRTLCLIGDSHSFEMKLRFHNHIFANNNNKKKTSKRDEPGVNGNQVKYVFLTYPGGWNQNKVDRLNREGCTDVIVAVGQWAISHHRPKRQGPMAPRVWIAQVQRLIRSIVDGVHPAPHVHLRMIHHTPLGFRKLACPPSEWMVPHYVDAYNEELRRLHEEMDVFRRSNNKLLDTYGVWGPVWDTNKDWNHLDGRTQMAENIHLLNLLASDTPLASTLDEEEASRDSVETEEPLTTNGVQKTTLKDTLTANAPFLLQYSSSLQLGFFLVLFLTVTRYRRRLIRHASSRGPCKDRYKWFRRAWDILPGYGQNATGNC